MKSWMLLDVKKLLETGTTSGNAGAYVVPLGARPPVNSSPPDFDPDELAKLMGKKKKKK